MLKSFILLYLLYGPLLMGSQDDLPTLQLNHLTDEESRVIIGKGTERPFSGKYYKYKDNGTYLCKQCNAPLYKSNDKFDSSCGWPSFDDAIKGAIKKKKDADGRRVEILCAKCNAHLGHVFVGEGLTSKNTRYCVNSISLNFEKNKTEAFKKAYFAGGCFWGVEYYLEKEEGVVSVESGYMGGRKKNPTYRDVSRGNSGYLELVEVVYDPSKVSYEKLARLFFEIHDPTQKNGQGPDIGSQYLSAIFVSTNQEKKIVQKLINALESNGYKITTEIKKREVFYKAEDYHQNYYDKKGYKPYCHGYVKRF